MFRTAELNHTLSKEEYAAREQDLRQELLTLQGELREADFPVILVFAGVDGAGKSETVNKLNEWLDTRLLYTRAFDQPSDEEQERPLFWRYWRELPPRGRVGMYLSSWYSPPLLDHVYGKITAEEFDERMSRIRVFEEALAADGALIIKFWMHLSESAQEHRLKKLEKDPLQKWRVTARDWEHWRMYDRFVAAAERTLMHTGTGTAPWKIIEGSDPRYRSIAVATILRDGIRRRLAERRLLHSAVDQADSDTLQAMVESSALPGQPTILSALDLGKALPKKDYAERLLTLQGRLNKLQRKAREKGVSSILVFEGWDAAGKGGAIRRITSAMDARNYQVVQIAKPTDEEAARHYLWRFWRHMSRAGRMTIFDRSWYGRVLVERVEGFARPQEWRRAYGEINDFEEHLAEHGIVLLKFWLHISRDEQEKRFRNRESTPWKAWKLTDEDWRNRERWGDYELAVNDMVEHTSTRLAPWVLVEAEDKYYARAKVLESVCEHLARALK
ncbi:polyphosphate:AMP phosphotransferase [Plasticicumulans acidivorans]|uniref:Polyphosphate:AMP phosphotransferase n=1 Tax=Plasticicumulans acidivorans TaxID=886464 RepID=A0A317MWG9_9GAMM|nr:polyphosphate:AMP phosphotransferase [Plasticicumulans acidivorans]PWV63246.1 polyphosphate:AMP phosphotransferase [Plasticicumulans acidivorans]